MAGVWQWLITRGWAGQKRTVEPAINAEPRYRPVKVQGPSASATVIAERRGVSPIDTWLLEAELALEMIAPEDMPKLAQDAMEAGNEGPAILRLAILEKPSGWEVDQLMPAIFKEMGMQRIQIEIAAMRVARELARKMLASGGDPLQSAAKFQSLWLKSDYSPELDRIGNLDDCFALMSHEQITELAWAELHKVAELEVE